MKDILFTVEYNKEISEDIFELRLSAEEKLPHLRAGQFLNLKVNDPSIVLRRPFCLYKFDEKSVTLIIARLGKGTGVICSYKAGDKVMAVLPLGNGFTLNDRHKKIALVGGGVGCAPLFSVPNCYKGQDKTFRAYFGFSDKSKIISELADIVCEKTIISTDNGTNGFKGYATDFFKDDLKEFRPDVILTCGPTVMMKCVAQISVQEKIPAYMSGESHMACGVGACLVCACKLKGDDGKYHHVRACADGPVFNLNDIILE